MATKSLPHPWRLWGFYSSTHHLVRVGSDPPLTGSFWLIHREHCTPFTCNTKDCLKILFQLFHEVYLKVLFQKLQVLMYCINTFFLGSSCCDYYINWSFLMSNWSFFFDTVQSPAAANRALGLLALKGRSESLLLRQVSPQFATFCYMSLSSMNLK